MGTGLAAMEAEAVLAALEVQTFVYSVIAILIVVGAIAVIVDRVLGGRPAEKKKCPACAEAVQREARVCKHCGHRFAPSSVAGPSD